MKICFITSKTIIKHATMKRAFGMANPLCLLEHDVTICLQESEDNREAMSRCPLAQAHYYQAGSALYERRQKQIFLERNSFDVVYICGLGVGNAINAKPLKSSFVLMDHVELESSIKDMPIRRRISQGILEWWSLFAYDASIAVSRYLEFLFLSRLHLFGVSRPVLWFPYAYDPDSLSINNANVAYMHTKYPNKKLIVFLGGLYKHYGCFEMLEAFKRLSIHRSDFIALICGSGPEKENAISFVKENNLEKCVSFQGYIPEEEVSTFLYGADVLLCPLHDTATDWARCPSKLLMYMAAAKPIVTCAIGEAREYLGSDGFYYQPSSVESMVKTIEKALDAKDWIPRYDPNLHTWEQRVDNWLNWIRECMNS